MKKDKLQEFADKSLSKYDNDELREQLVRESVSGNVAVIDNRKRNWLISIITVMIIAVLAFGTYMFWPKTPGEKHYLLENQTTTDIEIEEIISEIKQLQLNLNLVEFSQSVTDNQYNDLLYYVIGFTNEETGEKLNVVIVTNLEYNHTFNHNEYNKENITMNLRYTEQITEEDGIYSFISKGEFAIDDIKVFIQYDGLGLEPQSNFISFLQQCIEIKKGVAI